MAAGAVVTSLVTKHTRLLHTLRKKLEEEMRQQPSIQVPKALLFTGFYSRFYEGRYASTESKIFSIDFWIILKYPENIAPAQHLQTNYNVIFIIPDDWNRKTLLLLSISAINKPSISGCNELQYNFQTFHPPFDVAVMIFQGRSDDR